MSAPKASGDFLHSECNANNVHSTCENCNDGVLESSVFASALSAVLSSSAITVGSGASGR